MERKNVIFDPPAHRYTRTRVLPCFRGPPKTHFFRNFRKKHKKKINIFALRNRSATKVGDFFGFLGKTLKTPNMALKRDREAIGQHCGAEPIKKDSTIIDQRSRINDQRSKSIVSMGIPGVFDQFLTIFWEGGEGL